MGKLTLLILLLGGCATVASEDIAPARTSPTEAQMVNGLGQPLGTDALRALLSDANVTPVQPKGVITDHVPGEIFRSDGLYVQIRSRTRVDGNFDIRGGLLCVEGNGIKRQCRQVFFLGNNTYYMVDISNSSTIRVNITPHR